MSTTTPSNNEPMPNTTPPPDPAPSTTNAEVATALRHIKDDVGQEELVFDPRTGQLLVRRSGDAPLDALPATDMAREGFFSEPPPPDTNHAVTDLLGELKRDEAQEELYFDPRSGQLLVRRPGEEPSDALPATDMAREGFFARQAIVYEDEARLWLAGGGSAGPALAFEVDDDVVHHAIVAPADWRRTGVSCPGLVTRDAAEASPESLTAQADLHPEVRHLLALSDSSPAPAARSWTRGSQGWEPDEVTVVPTASVFSRNTGVLESNLLAERKVAIIGLGSGGAAIAQDLARAGVGRFLLCDLDRVEVHNVGRHQCDLRDLGRLKTRAVRDQLLARNPAARVDLLEGDVTADAELFREAVADCDVLIGATDNNKSRRLVNRVAVETGRPAIFGRAYARACGGDVIRVRPQGPCYECLVGPASAGESRVHSGGQVPAYSDKPAAVEPGLSMDIAPISMMCSRLALQELVRGTGSALESLDQDLDAPFFIWANRREDKFAQWQRLGASVSGMTVMRWYGSRAARVQGCPVCDEETFLRTLEA